MTHSKGICDDAMSPDMVLSSDFGGRSCGDAMSSHMPCAQDFNGFYAESFRRNCRRCEGVYDESFEKVLRRYDVVRHAMLFRFWGSLR